MRKALLTLMVVGTALAGAATGASAQSFYFGFGTGGGWRHHHHYYGSPYYQPYSYYQPYYRPYPAYGYADCYYRTRRHFDRYRGVWVVRRVRVCD